jgi:hypothetical protein
LLKGGQESQQRQEFKKNYKEINTKEKKRNTQTHTMSNRNIYARSSFLLCFFFLSGIHKKTKNKQTNKI